MQKYKKTIKPFKSTRHVNYKNNIISCSCNLDFLNFHLTVVDKVKLSRVRAI